MPPPGDGGVGGEPGPFLAAGARHGCAIFAEGAVRCWGDNSVGQLGRPPFGAPLADYSVDLGTGRRATGVYAGQYHSCVILEGGAVKCWGDNSFGHLGLGDMVNRGDGMSAMGDGLPVVDLGVGERATTLALGGTGGCALLEQGRLKCWGDAYQGATGYGDIEVRGGAPGTMGQSLPVVDLGSRDGARRRVKAIEAFEYHSFCAILEDVEPGASGLKCWGSNDYCELGIGEHEGGRGAVPGSLGDNLQWTDIGTTAAGNVRKAVAMAAGFQHICVLGDDGVVKCWGTNRSGELGLGALSSPRSCLPEELGNAGLVPLPAAATAIAARRERSCALLVTGDVTCWGVNDFGELGLGDTMERLSPSEPLVFGDGFKPERLVLGDDHTCAISADRRVKCWGSDEYGQLGPPVVGALHAPGPDLRLRGAEVKAVAAGNDHTCAILSSGALKCWGRNGEGQLGIGDTMNRGDRAAHLGEALPAVALGAEAVATAVAAGAAHTCVVLASGAVLCWGAGDAGQLGDGASLGRPAPGVAVPLPGKASAVAAGADFSCALLTDGRVLCWGAGARGQLGELAAPNRPEPGAAVVLPGKARAIAAGAHHACALLANQALACWGANGSGQLGRGDTQDIQNTQDTPAGLRPALVPLGARRPVAVAARVDSTCVLLEDKGITCWGGNERGQLGLGDAQARATPAAAPIELGTGRSALALAVGGGFACALLDIKQAKCWGDNGTYQLGALLKGPAYGDQPNEMGDFLAAALQGGGRSVREIVAGRAHACAILDTGDVRCWGDNSHGQLGAGDAEPHSVFMAPNSVVDLGGGP